MNTETSLKKLFGSIPFKRTTAKTKQYDKIEDNEKLDFLFEKTKGYFGIENKEDVIPSLTKYLSVNNTSYFSHLYKYLNGNLDIEDQYAFDGHCSLIILTQEREIKLNLRLREIDFDQASESIILNFEFINYLEPSHPLDSPYFKVYENLLKDLIRSNVKLKSFIRNSFYKERDRYSIRENFYTKLTSIYKSFEINIFAPTKKYIIAYKMDGNFTKSRSTQPLFECNNFTILNDKELNNLLIEYKEHANETVENIQDEFKNISKLIIGSLGLNDIETILKEEEEDAEEMEEDEEV